MPETDFLATFAGTVQHKNCASSTCLGNPIGTLEGRYLCAKHYERRARLMPESKLEAALEAESNPFNQRKLKDALAEVREWEADR